MLLKLEQETIIEMSNVRGKKVVIPSKLPFSFYFSSRGNANHSIRVKPVFNPNRLIASQTGTLKLSDDWEFIPGINDKNVKEYKISEMKEFFRKYIVLFCAVWDEQLQDGIVQDYFEGTASFSEVLQDFDFYDEHKNNLDLIETIEELENYCRDNNLVNFYGN